MGNIINHLVPNKSDLISIRIFPISLSPFHFCLTKLSGLLIEIHMPHFLLNGDASTMWVLLSSSSVHDYSFSKMLHQVCNTLLLFWQPDFVSCLIILKFNTLIALMLLFIRMPYQTIVVFDVLREKVR